MTRRETDLQTVADIRARLFALADPAYGDFQAGLMPGIPRERIIGVRVPHLRALAKELRGTPAADAFLAELPHIYYEENNLHGFLLDSIRDFDACLAATERFLPYIDSWATCDGTSPRALILKPDVLLDHVEAWVASDRTYTVRFGIETLMRHFLDTRFSTAYPDAVAELRSDAYYINMMIAWYFATALAKQYDAILPYIENRRLDEWTHNKTIQKAVESYRITDAQKAYLRTLKIR